MLAAAPSLSLGHSLTASRRQAPHSSRRRRVPLHPAAAVDERGRGGGAVLDRPGFETLGPGAGPATDSAGSKLDSSGGRGLGGGAWRVLLVDSDKHTEQRVVDAIVAVVPGTDEGHAANCFHTVRACVCACVRWEARRLAKAGWGGGKARKALGG